MNTTHRLILGLTATMLVCLTAHANTITTLYNTGVDAAGNPLPGGSIDPHYVITSPAGSAYVIGNPTSLGWASNTGNSTWISSTPSAIDSAITFTYETTFSLAGLNPSTAQINGNFWVDDPALQILLNGNLISTSGSGATWLNPTPFSITSGFVSGLNTLDFVFANSGGGVTGLQVQMTGTANALSNGVPDSGSTLTCAGLALLLWSVAVARTR